MSLDNLVKTGQLKAHVTSPTEVGRLLEAARRNLADAGHTSNSAETRFDCAYKAVMQCALVALHVKGYRPDTKRPGHHALVIQALPLTMGIAGPRIAVLDKLREKRNLADYTGAGVDEVATAACLREATRLVADIKAWLAAHHPEFIDA